MRRFIAGFGYALRGIARALLKERNLRFHLCAGGYVVFFGLRFYAFGPVEWALLAVCIAGVIALELVNSAIERIEARPDISHWLTAGEAKDMAAGGVLVFALGAAAAGLCLFWQPAVLRAAVRYYAAHPPAAALLALSAAAAGWFIFGLDQKSGG